MESRGACTEKTLMDARILVVDDDLRILQTLSRYLRLDGHTVFTADNGEAALQLFRQEHPDIVLTDVRMSPMDGFALLHHIREQSADAEVIFITGHGSMEVAIEALRAGASDFVPKPVDGTALNTALHHAQERIRLKNELRLTQAALRQERDFAKGLLANIQEQAQRLQQIIDTVPEGVLLLDAQCRVILANPLGQRDLQSLAASEIGDVLAHLASRPLAELLAPLPKGLWHEIVVNSRSFQVKARAISGATAPSGSSALPGDGWVVVIRDMTQQYEMERRAQQQERLAAVGQLAAGIAHDFNNIMASITLYAQMASRTPNLSARNQERLTIINQQALYATELIQQILDFGRRSVMERHPLELITLLKEQIRLLERTLPENIRITLQAAPGEYIIKGDPARLRQVFVNLAVNARDAMPAGGDLCFAVQRVVVTPETTPPLPELSEGEWVQIKVSDTGAGMEPDVLAHLFEPFFTTKAPGKGTGLGLAQVYGIVSAHDGYIDLQTQLNRGTAFYIYLPELLVERPLAFVEDARELPMGNGETVLVVEDNATTRAALVDYLETIHYTVLTAENGQQALERLEQQSPSQPIQVILSDVVMPVMGGIALLRDLQQRRWRGKIVLLTGHPLEEELQELWNLEGPGIFAGWLPKPAGMDQLATLIAGALPDPQSSEAL
ncbi:MAG TPA: response regulator [Anaerolineae bacterium]|nr:response regulator [Anaerolineae bacterium]